MLFVFLVNKILSNELGVEGYGQYSIIKKNIGVISFVMLGGMGIALPRYISYYKVKNDKEKESSIIIGAIVIVLFLSLLVFSLFAILKSELCKLIIGSSGNNSLYYASILFSFSVCLSSFLFSYSRGKGNFIQYNVTQIVYQTIILICCFFCQRQLLFLVNLWSFTTLIFTIFILSGEFKVFVKVFFQGKWFYLLRDSIQELLVYGLPRLLGDFVLFSFSAAPLIILNSKLGIKATAFFSVGVTLTNMITPLFSFLGLILLPYVSELLGLNQKTKIKLAVNKLLLVYIGLSVVMCIFIFYNANLFVTLLFSSKYLSSIIIIKIIIWSVLPQAIYLLLRNPLDAVSKIPFNTINLIISFLVMLFLLFNSKSLIDFSISFLISYSILASLSILAWFIVCKRYLIYKV